MKLYENEAKTIFEKYGIPIPKGETVTTSQEAREIATKLDCELAVKAQILVAGRGKAGGIQFGKNPEEIEKIAQRLLNSSIKGTRVKKLLIEEKLFIKRELYFAITVDRFNRCYVAVASAKGGVNIEDIATQNPQRILRIRINPQIGFQSLQAKQIAQKLRSAKNESTVLEEIFKKTYKLCMDYDAEMVEINPLIENSKDEFVAADARIIIDDNALFRHPEYLKKSLQEQRDTNPQEAQARKKGIEYVKLDGNIGIVGNGAGLVMATLDLISFYEGKPANFLDIGGGASPQKIIDAIETVLSDDAVKVLFINILGGVTRCDQVAKAIVKVKNKQPKVPFIVRLMGTNEEEGKRILFQAKIYVFDNMEQAAHKAVETATKGK